jgi:hypothetical protein
MTCGSITNLLANILVIIHENIINLLVTKIYTLFYIIFLNSNRVVIKQNVKNLLLQS